MKVSPVSCVFLFQAAVLAHLPASEDGLKQGGHAFIPSPGEP